MEKPIEKLSLKERIEKLAEQSAEWELQMESLPEGRAKGMLKAKITNQAKEIDRLEAQLQPERKVAA